MHLFPVLVVEVNSLFADQRMTEQSLGISANVETWLPYWIYKFEPRPLADVVFPRARTMPTAKRKADQPGILNVLQSKCHSMFKRDFKETSFIYLLLRARFHSKIIWGGYRRIVIFSLIRNNSNFLVLKATEQITKYTQSCLEIMRKYAPKMKEKAFLSILNQNFPGGACPQKLGPYGPKLHALSACKVLPLWWETGHDALKVTP